MMAIYIIVCIFLLLVLIDDNSLLPIFLVSCLYMVNKSKVFYGGTINNLANSLIKGGNDDNYRDPQELEKIIIYNDGSGRGLSNDNYILWEVLTNNKIVENRILNINDDHEKKYTFDPYYDIFIHNQNIKNGAIAKFHIWVPNQEVITDWDWEQMNSMDLVICKTHITFKRITQLYRLKNKINIKGGGKFGKNYKGNKYSRELENDLQKNMQRNLQKNLQENRHHYDDVDDDDNSDPSDSESDYDNESGYDGETNNNTKANLDKIIYTGFTSKCSYPPSLKKYIHPDEYQETEKPIINVIHLGGSSPYKNTHLIIAAWIYSGFHKMKNLNLTITFNFSVPFLTVMKNLIQEEVEKGGFKINFNDVKKNLPYNIEGTNITIYSHIENMKHVFDKTHFALCMSANEGFSHYINQCKYYGILPITVDAAPMNELIKDSRLLIKSKIDGSINKYTKARNFFQCPECDNNPNAEKFPAPAYSFDFDDFKMQFLYLINSTDNELNNLRTTLHNEFAEDKAAFENNISFIIKNIKLHENIRTAVNHLTSQG